jgi:hypothetical protein
VHVSDWYPACVCMKHGLDKSGLFLGLSQREQKYDAKEVNREAPDF